MSKAFLIRSIFLSIATVMLILFMYNCHGKNARQNTSQQLLIEALTSKLKISYDEQGHQIAEKQTLVLEYNELQKIHAPDSSEIGRLKKLVKKNTAVAAIVNTSTSGTLTGTTTVTYNNPPIKDYDTLAVDSCNPVYTAVLVDKWSNIQIEASRDTTFAKYKIFNEFEFTLNYKKQGRWPFRIKAPTIAVKSLNPNTVTTGISAYAVPTLNHKKRNTAIAVSTFILGVVGTVILLR